MRRILLLAALAPLALSGCSSWIAGLAAGGAGGVTGPGAAAVKVTGCDLSAEGSLPLTGVEFNCSVSPDGTMTKSAKIQSADPTTILLQGFQAQAAQAQANAQLLQQLAPVVAQGLAAAGGTVAAGPVGGAAAGALAKALTTPKPAATSPQLGQPATP